MMQPSSVRCCTSLRRGLHLHTRSSRLRSDTALTTQPMFGLHHTSGLGKQCATDGCQLLPRTIFGEVTYLGICRAVKSQVLLCEGALSRLDCLLGLHAEAANHCRLVRCGDGDAEDSDSIKFFAKTARRLVMASMFAGGNRAVDGVGNSKYGAFPSIIYKHTERHLSWRTTRLPANGH